MVVIDIRAVDGGDIRVSEACEFLNPKLATNEANNLTMKFGNANVRSISRNSVFGIWDCCLGSR